VGPCQHCLVGPRLVDGGGTLQIWTFVENMVTMQLQTANK